jgi:hypothetical protein
LSESWRDFEALLRRHQSMVYSIALRITGEPDCRRRTRERRQARSDQRFT